MKKLLTFFMILSLYHAASAQCDALEINSNKSTVCAPDLVNFQLLNAPDSATFEWNFGNGYSNGSASTVGYFSTAGSVDVSVRITLPNGNSCVHTENNMIIVREKPTPVIDAESFTLCNGPEELTFTDNTPAGYSRNWIIDGTNYNNAAKSITHKFTSLGTKNITLISVDSFGCQGVTQLQDTIKIYETPQFEIESEIVKGCAPQTTSLKVIELDDLTPFTVIYDWTIEGAQRTKFTGSEIGPLKFNTAGKFDASLLMTVSNGCSYELEKTDYFKFGEESEFTASLSDTDICKNNSIQVVVSSSNTNGNLNWNIIGYENTTTIDKFTKEFSPTTSGTIEISVKNNDNGCVSKEVFEKNIIVKEVKANFTSEDNYHCVVPHTVHLENISDAMDASSLNYTWNIYNNGSLVHTSTNLDDSMTFYSLPAFYDVELIVEGDNGCTDTLIKKSFIRQDSMDVSFKAIPDIGCIGQEINFKNTSKPSTYIEDDEYFWTIYDLDMSILDTTSEKDAAMTYFNTGIYTVQLIGYNSLECRDTFELEAVEIIDPVIKFTLSDTVICFGDKIIATSLNDPLLEEMDHKWILTNKSTLNSTTRKGVEVNFTPDAIGEYTLTYSFEIEKGCYNEKSIDIFVNGVEGEISLEDMQQCAPFNAQPEFNISNNLHEGSNNNKLNFNWTVSPSSDVAISNNTSATPSFILNNEGLYTISLEVENSAGCSSSFELNKVQAGIVAKLNIPDNTICYGDTLMVRNRSNNSNTNYRYEIRENSDFTVSSLGNKDAIFLLDSGNFTLDLIAEKDGECADTASANFRIIRVIADFASNDTFLKCAPVYVQFNSLSINQDSLFWDFGDGNSYATTDLSAGTVYQNNTGESKGYDVQLIASNSEGCKDTLLKQDFIRVSGPRPKFNISNFKACETTEVVFENLTKGASYTLIDYMDGSALDSSLSTHVYTKSTDKEVEKFFPTIYVGDDNGCVAEYRSPQAVILYANPTPSFELPNLDGLCVPFELEVTNTSVNIVSSEWSIDGALSSTEQDLNVNMKQYGAHSIQLAVTNKYGCTDSIYELIELQGTPQIDILMEDSICLYNTLNFNALIAQDDFIDTSGMTIEWNFDEEGHPNNEINNKLDPQFAYFTSGHKDVRLKISLSNGCSDSLVYPLDLRGSEDLDKPSIKYVSFEQGYELELKHEKSSDDHFAAYQYSRSDGTVMTNNNQSKTTYFDDFVVQPDSVLCYDIAITDNCGLFGAASRTHCFIYLAVTSNKSFKNELEWTKYIGWDNVVAYNIFRKTQDDADYTLIASVDAETTRYEDGGLCDNVYEYYVQAVNDKNESSNSFKVVNRPEISENTFKSSIKNATVLKDDQILVSWNQSAFEHFDHFLLSKYQENTNRWIEDIELTDTFYTDKNVSTSEYSYIYFIREVDLCGSVNQADRKGKTILLEAGYDNELHSTTLNWSKYEEWKRDVDHYVISLETVDGIEVIGTTTASVTNFTDEEYHETLNGKYCYIVEAIGKDGDTSASNMVCVNGDPISYIPNAFSPNGDGLNDKFRPICRFVDHQAQINGFNMEVYNRWGELIFRTNDLIEGWDGNYKGKECQQGAYIYKLHYKGVDGINYYHNGTITLVK